MRSVQAETQSSGEGYAITSGKRRSKFFRNVKEGKQYDFGSSESTLLVDRTESERMEILANELQANIEDPVISHSDQEQTFSILEGTGSTKIADEMSQVNRGDVIFLPRVEVHSWNSGDKGLKYICQSTFVEVPLDESFEEMYERISPDRTRRSEPDSSGIGELDTQIKSLANNAFDL